MTKEIVELPDKHTGDINEIRDKKIALAKDATAQSDLPQQLEYLIKNGQTGEFMNVLDSYINEKIRSALGSLIASLDKGAAGTTKAIACIDTNNDLGIINPANLASVLGGFSVVDFREFPTTRGAAGDLDQHNMTANAFGYRCGWCSTDNSSLIRSTAGVGFCIDFNMIVQIVLTGYRVSHGTQLVIRFRNGNNWESFYFNPVA